MRHIWHHFLCCGLFALAVLGRADSQSTRDQIFRDARAGNCQAAEGQARGVATTAQDHAAEETAVALCKTRQGHPEEASADFEAAVRAEPKAWEGWNNLGANYLVLRRFSKSAEAFRRATTIDPNVVSPWYNLGSCLLQSGSNLDAFTALNHAYRLAPGDVQINGIRVKLAGVIAGEAANAIDRGQYAEAFRMLSATSEVLENSASWNNLIGYAAFKLGKPEIAKRHLETALRMDPNNEGYLLDVGEFLASYRAYSEAVRFFEVGLTRMPHSAPVRFGLAVSYMLEGNLDRATPLLEQLHAADPLWEPVNLALGEGYESGGRWSAMLRLGVFLQSKEPSNAFAWYLEGAARERLAAGNQTQLSEAIADLRRAVALEPRSSRDHYALGRALQDRKEFPGAVAEFENAMRLDPADTKARYALARTYAQMGKRDSAQREFEILARAKAKTVHDTYLAFMASAQHSHLGP